MAKRLSDTEKYKKSFIRSLPGAYKIFWDYICLDCNHAGVWHVDFDIAQIYIGKDMPINEKEALSFFNNGEERIRVFDSGKKWLIIPFISFQYGELNPVNRVHLSVINELKKEGFSDFSSAKRAISSKGHTSPLEGAKDKDKDIDKDKDKDKDKDGIDTETCFENIWMFYPKKLGKKNALKHFKTSVKTEKDLEDCMAALKKYTEHIKTIDPKFIQYGSTWFNGWRDWVNYVEPKKVSANSEASKIRNETPTRSKPSIPQERWPKRPKEVETQIAQLTGKVWKSI
jgi:hypothetical protein